MKDLEVNIIKTVLTCIVGVIMTILVQICLSHIFNTDLSGKFWWILFFILIMRTQISLNIEES